jgi:GNAT superfamily N-acetyltransferase
LKTERDQASAHLDKVSDLVRVTGCTIRPAIEADVLLILSFIQKLAEYERLRNECVATEEKLRATLFGEKRFAEVLIAEWNGAPAGFALFFHNYSTFLAKPGLYLEDLFVDPEMRGNGIGKALLVRLAQIALERGCGRFEWWVLDWNEPSINFYKSLGAEPMNDWTVFRVTGEKLKKLASAE